MKKIVLSILFTFIFAVAFTFSPVFAANNVGQSAVDGVRNVVGGAENMIENVAGGVNNGVHSGMNTVENTTANHNTTRSTTNQTTGTVTSTNNMNKGTTGYTATRTTANNTGTFLGMNGTTWTWLIVAIAGIAIFALVWSYVKNDRYHHDDDR